MTVQTQAMDEAIAPGLQAQYQAGVRTDPTVMV